VLHLRSSLIVAAALVAVVLGAWRLSLRHADPLIEAELAPFSLQGRPASDRLLFDYAAALRHYEEGAARYLERIATRFHIEALIVSVPALPAGHSVDTLALDLVDRWRIGAEHEGRGLLLLLVDDTKQVKLEVGYELEDVFTDGFSGWVEDLQLAPYYREGDVGTGLVAVMEMLEARARIKHQGDSSPGRIGQADQELLSGGAGATRHLERLAEADAVGAVQRPSGRGARSPEEAWEIMLAQWAGEGRDLGVDVYTEMTRIAMGDANRPDARTLRWLDHWREADYQVLRQGDHSVIWFGAIDGWENSPFLFCDTGDGWKFDIVHQRRLVVMAESPKWQVAQGAYPYVSLMGEAWQSTGKDLPLSSEDLYHCRDDAALAARMEELEVAIAADAEDAAATLELMRLRVITGQRPKRVRPLIERARRLAPERAEPWKYSAIFNVNSFFQYRTALADIERYIELAPSDLFGYAMKGFLLYRLGEHQDSIQVLERAVELDPESAYAYALMARCYALLARHATGPEALRYREQAREMRRRAGRIGAPDDQRLAWLDAWLARRL
jgi:tetratricopeptide (TPR) repeat protein